MADGARVAAAFAFAALASLTLTPLAIRIARRTGFLDRPLGWKRHRSATPYLGGAVVVFAFLAAVALFARGWSGWPVALVSLMALLAVGLVDDWTQLEMTPRLVVEVICAAAIFEAGLGCSQFSSGAANFAVTVVFIVAVVNAYNLIDTADGVLASVALGTSIPVAGYALLQGDAVLAAGGAALSGACVGFLRFNLATPARIFLGDAGSTTLGFIAALTVMNLPGGQDLGPAMLPTMAVLIGLPAFDAALIAFSRARRGTPLLDAGPESIACRLTGAIGSAKLVAAVALISQGALTALALSVWDRQPALAGGISGAVVLAGLAAIAFLELEPGHQPTVLEAAADPARPASPT